MYRGNRFSQVNRPDRAPIVVTGIITLVLLVAIACGVHGDKTKGDTSIDASSETPVPPAEVTAGTESVPVAARKVTFASAQTQYAKRQYREATESFDLYVHEHPDNAYGLYMLGLSAWKWGDLDRARNALEGSLQLDSTNVKTLLNLGRVLLDQGHAGEALTRVTAAIEIDSGSAEARRVMARVQSVRGQPDSAMASYRLALSMDPGDSWSMNNLGLLLIDQGRYEEALRPLARAVELRPEAPTFANNLGIALERSGHLSAAAETYRTVLKNDSTYSKASVSLARVEPQITDSTRTDGVDLGALAASFNDELQLARLTRPAAKVVIKPDSVQQEKR